MTPTCGKWSDLNSFEMIGDLADEIIADAGVMISYRDNGDLYVDIPYAPETIPEGVVCPAK